MRRAVRAVTFLALLLPATAALTQDEFYMLAGFDIAVSRTPQGISLACQAGCTWKTLAFPVKGKSTAVNEDGLAGGKTGNPENAGRFLLRFDTTDDGFALSCDRGCAWRTLGWSVRKDDGATRITEYGIAPRSGRQRL